MPITTLLPSVAALAFVGYGVAVAARDRRATWALPAGLAVAFLALSAWAIATLGPLGFWTEHVRNAWGNQIWVDLLLAVGVAWGLLVPRMRAVGMRPGPWFCAVVLTGSVGLLALVARWLYLRDAARDAAAS